MLRVATVRWLDASHDSGPLTKSGFSGGLEILTTGFLVQNTEEEVSLAQDYLPHTERWRDVTHIPRCYILAHQGLGKAVPVKKALLAPRGA